MYAHVSADTLYRYELVMAAPFVVHAAKRENGALRLAHAEGGERRRLGRRQRPRVRRDRVISGTRPTMGLSAAAHEYGRPIPYEHAVARLARRRVRRAHAHLVGEQVRDAERAGCQICARLTDSSRQSFRAGSRRASGTACRR